MYKLVQGLLCSGFTFPPSFVLIKHFLKEQFHDATAVTLNFKSGEYSLNLSAALLWWGGDMSLRAACMKKVPSPVSLDPLMEAKRNTGLGKGSAASLNRKRRQGWL